MTRPLLGRRSRPAALQLLAAVPAGADERPLLAGGVATGTLPPGIARHINDPSRSIRRWSMIDIGFWSL
jgi:hypothetical protein